MKLLARATLLILVLILNGCALGGAYSAKSIEGWVVDAQTKQPLEGVSVVAYWVLRAGVLEDSSVGELTVLESVTDRTGRYSFPAWGPKPLPPGVPATTHLVDEDPQMDYYKAGYRNKYLRNSRPDDPIRFHGPSVRASDWNGKTIEMADIKSQLNDRAQELRFFAGSMDSLSDYPCYWRHIPQTLVALDKESKTLKSVGLKVAISRIEILLTSEEFYLAHHPQCGSPRKFFEGYLK